MYGCVLFNVDKFGLSIGTDDHRTFYLTKQSTFNPRRQQINFSPLAFCSIYRILIQDILQYFNLPYIIAKQMHQTLPASMVPYLLPVIYNIFTT